MYMGTYPRMLIALLAFEFILKFFPLDLLGN